MESKRSANPGSNISALLYGSLVTIVVLLIMNKGYPLVGHDYRYFIPRILDTDLHIFINGISIQWYTPSFGGGLPAFPNPQHLEYSVVQLLSLWFTPWIAILISTAGISLAGFYWFYKFLFERLELNWKSSILGAVFLIGNGFFIEHLIVGHLGYQLFPLGGIILYALTDPNNRVIYHANFIAIMFSLMIWQAGFYLIIILLLSIGMTLSLIYIYKPSLINFKKLLFTCVIIFLITVGMAASKIYAVLAFLQHFPREISDVYDNTGFLQAPMGLIAQLLGMPTFGSLLILTKQNPDLLSGGLSNITGANYGIWELDIGLSPILLLFLFGGLAQALKAIRQGGQYSFSNFLKLIPLLLSIWITLELTFARGPIYMIVKQFPLIRSLHVNTRFAAAFILPLIVLGAIPIHDFFIKHPKNGYFFALVTLSVLPLFTYFMLTSDIHGLIFDANLSNVIYKEIRNGNQYPITHIANADPFIEFMGSASTSSSYEPIFGYNLENFKPEIHTGNILDIENGYFNMTNPASLVFPELNNLHPFERFKINEKDKLEAFLNRRQPQWEIPQMQKALNHLALITIILSAGTLALTFSKKIHTEKLQEK